MHSLVSFKVLRFYINYPKNYLYLRIKTKPVTVGTDATV